MNRLSDITADLAWAAFEARDRSFDGRFVVAVATTGIYCRPSCPARRPARDNVEILCDGAAARAGGYRPCKRCLPGDVSREEAAVERAIALLHAADEPMPLVELARETGYSPSHLQRIFKRAVGLSPAAFERTLRLDRASDALSAGRSVTDAIYEAGFGASSRFYEASEGGGWAWCLRHGGRAGAA
jgi:AraC family transcriptional regulator of adaptative response/methylated-DNA-[protein]-cysteine methyltransferase